MDLLLYVTNMQIAFNWYIKSTFTGDCRSIWMAMTETPAFVICLHVDANI